MGPRQVEPPPVPPPEVLPPFAPEIVAPRPLPPWMSRGPLERIAAGIRHFIRSGRLLMALSALVFCVAVFAIWRQLHAHSMSEITVAFGAIPLHRFFIAALLVIAAYALITFNDRLALKIIGRELSRREHVAASVAGYAVARSLGYAFLTAATTRMRLYMSAGLSAAETGRLSLYTGLTAQMGAATACATGLLLGANNLMQRSHVSRALLIGLALALILVVFVWVRNNAKGGPNARDNSPTAWVLIKHIGAAALAWICAAGVLEQLMTVHGGLRFPAFVAVFVVATVAGALSGVPGGLGVFEATIIALTRAQGLASTAAALIIYRLMYNVVPLAFAAGVLAWDQWSAARRAAHRRASERNRKRDRQNGPSPGPPPC